MQLQHAAEFTAYEEDGCPMHPSYPAMHSAASTCSYWIPALCRITAAQYCEALRVDYATAYARTVAGVHYPMDNIVGTLLYYVICCYVTLRYVLSLFGLRVVRALPFCVWVD